MGVEPCVTFWYMFKTKHKYFLLYFHPIFSILSTLSNAQYLKVIGLIFFLNKLALKNRAINMHFNPVPIFYDLFLYIELRPYSPYFSLKMIGVKALKCPPKPPVSQNDLQALRTISLPLATPPSLCHSVSAPCILISARCFYF